MQHHYDKATQTYWRPPNHAVSLKHQFINLKKKTFFLCSRDHQTSLWDTMMSAYIQHIADLYLIKHNLTVYLMQRIM